MTCVEFERWLDDGMPDVMREAADRHVAACPSCAAALAVARELDAMLARAVVVAPDEITNAVLARIAVIEARLALARELPWWVRATADPAAALAFTAAALALWQRQAMIEAGGLFAARATAWVAELPGAVAGASSLGALESLTRPEILAGLVLAASPLLAWSAAVLWNRADRRV